MSHSTAPIAPASSKTSRLTRILVGIAATCAIGGVFATVNASHPREGISAMAPMVTSQAVALPSSGTSVPDASAVFSGVAAASEEAAPTF